MLRRSDIPELADHADASIRIPGEINVPLSARVRRLIDTPAMCRLRHVRQLGLVSLVYPGATHDRFEHSLGVYRLALQYLQRLLNDPSFAREVSAEQALAFLVTALVHDIGHWPFCHPLEDLRLDALAPHETLATEILRSDPLASLLDRDFGLAPDAIVNLLVGHPTAPGECILQSMLSGPIDVDKMDYLFRDSLHAGVPYGRNFDASRLIDSLCVASDGRSLAISAKGHTAAEMMVFARYIMFSEVYWHHAVRSATAMLQRAFFELRDRLDINLLQSATESQFIEHVTRVGQGHPVSGLIQGIFGPQRCLYKRWLEFNCAEQESIYCRFARQPFHVIRAASQRLAELLSSELGQPVPPESVLIDAPPPHLEIQFHLEVRQAQQDRSCQLAEVSPVVHALATQQFDDIVKRVRVFVAAELREAVTRLPNAAALMESCAESISSPAATATR